MYPRWTILAVLCASLLLVAIDVTVLHTVAPVIAEQLRPSAVELLWVVDVYALVAAPLLLVFGTLGDRFGRRRLLLVGYAVFGLASVLVSASTNPQALIAARGLLGAGGAMIMPTTLSLIRQVFPDPGERATAIGAWSATAGAGAIIGPLVGGLLAEHFWWGAVFLLNVPVMVVAIPLARWLLPESVPARGRRWDALGGVLAGAGVLAVSSAIKEAAQHPPAAAAVFLAGAALLVAFVRRQRRIPHPLLDVRLFTDPRVTAAVATVVTAMAALVGVEFALAQYLQLVLGDGPLWAGVRLLPMTLASIVGSLLGAPLVRAAGALVTASAGLAVTAASLVPLLWLSSAERPWLLAGAISGIGLGLSAGLTAASTALMGSVREQRAGEVAGVEETCYELGGSLGVSVLGSVVGASYATRLDRKSVV